MERTILVVDDEERLARSLAELLRGEGYEVDWAIGGRAGIAALDAKAYRLLITDLRMPEVDGFQLIDHVSRHHHGTAVIVITGHATTQSAIDAIHLRVADYLTKPFEFDFLLASIEKVFAQIEAEELREDMVRMISHDIKVPLNSIMGFAQFLIDRNTGQPSARAAEFADKIAVNSQRILALLDNYLTQARAEVGRLEVMPQAFSLAETLDEATKMIASDFQRKHIDFVCEPPPEIDFWAGDEHLVFRAISNLLSNAAKYTPEGGKCRVRLARETRPELGPVNVVIVENTGPGIAEDEIGNVFKRWHRTRESRGQEGSGMGLYVVWHVARAHGGLAECESRPGELTTFRIVLPVVPRQTPAK